MTAQVEVSERLDPEYLEWLAGVNENAWKERQTCDWFEFDQIADAFGMQKMVELDTTKVSN